MELEASDEKNEMVSALDHGLGHRGDADSIEEPSGCQGPLPGNARIAQFVDFPGRQPSSTRSEPPDATVASELGYALSIGYLAGYS